LIRQEGGEVIDEGEFTRQVEAAVKAVVEKQLAAGIDIGNDGEEPRPGFAGYVTQRMKGFGGSNSRLSPKRRKMAAESPEFLRFANLGACVLSRV